MSIRAVVGVALLALAAGCYEDEAGNLLDSGRRPLARVLLTDAPFPYDSVHSVNVHIVSLSASVAPDTSEAAEWIPIAQPNRVYDLLALQQGTTALLGEGRLTGRLYRAIRMVIDTDQSSVRWKDGDGGAGAPAIVRWPWPGSGLVTLHALVHEPLFLLDGEDDIEIVIDWDVGRSFLYDYYGTAEFTVIPWLRAVHSAYTGAIAGVVTTSHTGESAPVRNAGVTVYSGNPNAAPGTWYVVATGRTDAAGEYRVAFVGGGTYIVRIEHAASPFLDPVVVPNVVVTDGATTTVSAELPAAGASGGAYLRISGPATVGVGGTITLLAALGDESGVPVEQPAVSWSTSDDAIASVTTGTDTAAVTGHEVGWATITAASNGLETSVDIQVVGSPEPVAGVTVVLWNGGQAGTLAVDDSSGARAELRDAAGNLVTSRPIAWYSTNGNVVEITGAFGEHVVIRARAAGTALLRATSEGKIGEASITVE